MIYEKWPSSQLGANCLTLKETDSHYKMNEMQPRPNAASAHKLDRFLQPSVISKSN